MSQVDGLIRALEIPEHVDEQWRVAAERDARTRLRAEMAEVRQPSRARRVSRERGRAGWGWRRLWVPSLLATGLGTALVLIFALLPGGRGALPELGVGQATAQAVLARAAQIATVTPASTVPDAHQFLYVEWVRSSTGTETGKGHAFSLTTGQTEQDWEAPNGSGRQRLSGGFYRFLTPADRLAWHAAGSPRLTFPGIDGTYPRGAYFNNCDITPRGPSGLSTDPSQLLEQVVRTYEHGRYNAGLTLATAACILVTSDYPPLRAATYRMIEHLQGVRLLGAMRDGIGRRGVAVAVPDQKAGLRSVVIFDRVNAKPLELETIQTRAVPLPGGMPKIGDAAKNLPNGTVVESQILVASGVVNSEEALPGGGSVPFHHPPKIHVRAPAVPANPTQPLITTLAGLRHELAILRRFQNPSDRLPAWAVTDEQRQGCSNCLNVAKLIPGETRLLASFKIPHRFSVGQFGMHGPERVYLVLGTVPGRWGGASRASSRLAPALGGWHQRGPAISGLHLGIVGFVNRNTHVAQPIDDLLNPGDVSMPEQALTPVDVMIGQFGTVGLVPDGVTKVRWELIDPGQARPVTVYPRVRGNVAVAPLTPSHEETGLANEQLLASAVWYGPGGRVIASVNELPSLRHAFGW